jgi:hypothetical protein
MSTPEQPAVTAVVVPEAPAPIMTQEQVEQVVLTGDYAGLGPEQRAYCLLVLSKKMGLDPMRRPFEFISDGKSIRLYANRSAAAQLREVHKITQTPVYMGALRSITFAEDGSLVLGEQVITDKVMVSIFKAVSKDKETGELRVSYDLSAMALDKQLEWMENGLKKMWTQASRRTTIGHAGLGFLDESEAQDVGRPMSAPPPAQPAPTRRVPPPPTPAQIPAAPVGTAPLRVPARPAAPQEVVEAEVVDAHGRKVLESDAEGKPLVVAKPPASEPQEAPPTGWRATPAPAPQSVAAQPQQPALVPSSTLRVVQQAPPKAPQAQPAPAPATVAGGVVGQGGYPPPRPPQAPQGAAPASLPGPRPLPKSPLPPKPGPVKVR